MGTGDLRFAVARWIAPLLAQDVAGPVQGPGIFDYALLFGGLLVLILFLVVLPERQASKKREQELGGLKKNDRVLTSAGIYGLVVNVRPNEDQLVIKIDEDKNVTMTVQRSSVVRVLTKAAGDKPAAG